MILDSIFVFFILNSNTYLAITNNAWSVWRISGPCNATCGMGTRSETRSCDSLIAHQGGQTHCPGNASRIVHCKIQDCPCVVVDTQQICPSDDNVTECLYQKMYGTLRRVAKAEEARIYIESGFDAKYLSESSGTDYVFRNTMYHDLRIHNDEYVLLKSGSIACHFREVKNGFCGQRTTKYAKFSTGKTSDCHPLPICDQFLKGVSSYNKRRWSEDSSEAKYAIVAVVVFVVGGLIIYIKAKDSCSENRVGAG